jgi:signal transduction histidine kinase
VRRSELSWRRSYVGVPICARGKAVGFINVSSSTPGYYTQEHAERLRAFADQAAIALENARLFAAEQQRAAELARALDQQRELDRLQREFIQNVSHELRTPLALIRGHAEVLDSGWLGALTPEQKDSLGVIVRRAQMLGKLIEDIVAILAAERREYKRETVDLAVLVRTTVADFEPNAVKSDLRLLAQVAPNVPSVSGDPLALRRVLDNLLGNAFKFTSPGGQVAVRLRQEDGAIVLQVADTGVGIPPDKLGRVFERFYQVDGSSTRQYGGVGLGLALVKEIVEAHGGQITVTSQVGAGTTFTLSFPIE